MVENVAFRSQDEFADQYDEAILSDGENSPFPLLSMTTANRDYTKGSSEMHAVVMVGQSAVAALAPLQNTMNIQTTDGHMITASMHGMNVLKGYNNKDKSGSLIVGVSKDAMFSLSYKNMTENEALALAEKFDWKAIQAAAQAK